LWLVLPRISVGPRALAAIIIEGGWEILDNTNFIIDRYRETTIALDYYGDSVLNSVSDLGFMLIGFFLAFRLPVWATILIAIVFEVVVGLVIRDNLTLNVLMLLYPLESVLRWQSGG